MDPFTWLLIGSGIKLGLDLFGQSQQAKAEAEMAKVKRQAAKLRGEASVRKLELERGNTLSQLTARAGRAGVETSTTEAVTSGKPVGGTEHIVAKPGGGYQAVVQTTPMTVATSGAGGSVLMQQQRVADLYEQDIIYTKQMMALEMRGADIEADYSKASANLDMIGSILETGTDLYASWYRYDQMNIPDSYNPYKVKLGVGESWGEGY